MNNPEDHWKKVTDMMVLYLRRKNYYEQAEELKSHCDNITDTDLIKLLLLTKTAMWYDEYIQQRENQG